MRTDTPPHNHNARAQQTSFCVNFASRQRAFKFCKCSSARWRKTSLVAQRTITTGTTGAIELTAFAAAMPNNCQAFVCLAFHQNKSAIPTPHPKRVIRVEVAGSVSIMKTWFFSRSRGVCSLRCGVSAWDIGVESALRSEKGKPTGPVLSARFSV